MVEFLENARIRGVALGAVALVEDEQGDVLEAEEAVAEVVQEDLRRHDKHLGVVHHAAPDCGVPEVDAHVAGELGHAEVGMRLDDPCLLLHEHAGGDEEDGEVPRRLPHAVRVRAQQQPRDERLPGPRIQESHRVPAHGPLQRLQLVPSGYDLRILLMCFPCRVGGGGGGGGVTHGGDW